MTTADGDGWVDCTCGSRHWGRFGAAGLVLVRQRSRLEPRRADVPVLPSEVLLQLRAGWTHEGGVWAVPGGARDSHEDDVATALREAEEEAGVPADAVQVLGRHTGADHGGWTYTYVIALADGQLAARRRAPSPRTLESAELRWVSLDAVARLSLHSGLAAAWPELAEAVRRALLLAS